MLLPTLDTLIQSRSLLRHPFYQLWNKGELTIEDLKIYTKEYYHLVKHIPLIVSRMLMLAPEDLRGRLRDHAEDETRHIGLWIRFAGALGLREDDVETHVPSAQTREAVTSLIKLTEQGFLGSVAAMYALERELPKIAQTKLQGLMRFYGLRSSDARAYFEEHVREEEHFSFWQELLRKLTGEEAAKAEAAARSSMEAQNQILDAVCEIRGISCDCER